MEFFNIEKDIAKMMPFIKRRCNTYIRYDQDKLELLYSEVLEKVIVRKGKFEGNETDFQKWVSIVIYNCFIDGTRYKKDKLNDNLSDIPDYKHPFSGEDIFS